MILTLLAIFLILISSCDRLIPKRWVDLDCGSQTEKTFENWRSWTKVNQTPLLSEGHPNSYVYVYIDDLAKDTYLTVSAPFPECARIIKAKYTDQTASEVVRVAVMVKMLAGYDTRNNDWWYARYDPTGTQSINQGKMYVECGRCHRRASATDYVFSEDVLAAAND